MKENFEQSLLQTNEEIKKYKTAETDTEKGSILQEMERMEKEYIHDDVWSQETSKEVIALQLKKHKVMEELHEKIQALEKGEAVSGFTEGEPRSVEWNKAGHRAMVALPSGKRAPATVGELVTDGEWGIAYVLGKDIPKDIKKRFVVAEARRKILAFSDEQIIETERVKKTTREGGDISPSYRNIFEDVDKEKKTGFIAEKLVKTFFQKNIIDHGLNLRMEEVDVQRDIDQKIDFILRLPHQTRGVGAESSRHKEDIGIQLTIDDTARAQERKNRQILEAKKHLGEDVDDIVLVTLPLTELSLLLHQWKKDEMRPGGPIKRWDDPKKEQIFRGVLQGLFSEKEITGMWESILGETPEVMRVNHEEPVVESEEKLTVTQKIETRTPDEGGKENLDKFANKYSKWFGKKK
ncbi:MAG: hypothetical protein NT098_02945 [Candidatus Parcubacteria bacterium]|nr:hypothetical protein [Candidatus Parcubacteria bacterium]